MIELSSRCFSGPAENHQLAESSPGNLYVSLGCLSAALLERVEHIDSLGEFGDVQNAMFQGRVHTNFTDARANSGYRLPIKRLQALLDRPELETDQSSSVPRERAHVGPGRAQPFERLLSHGVICKYSYIVSSSISFNMGVA